MTQLTSNFSLDHIAIAVPDIDEALDQLRLQLGATIISGDEVPGYRFAMTRIGDADSGMNLEVLEPWETGTDDSLQRFLQRHGAAPHHITFLQHDICSTVNTLNNRGYRLVRTKLNFGPWQESFIHPSHGFGTVIQIAGSTVPTPPMTELLAAAYARKDPPLVPYDEEGQNRFWWEEKHPPRSNEAPAVLERIVIHIKELNLVHELFVDVFLGEVVSEDSSSVEVRWGTSGQIRFVEATESCVAALEVSGLENGFSIGSAYFRPLSD